MDAGRFHLSPDTEGPQRHTPLESLVLAYAAMVPIAAGALACLLLPGPYERLAVHLTIIWSGAVICFLAGVRRGLSFRQAGGPLLSQIATMLGLFTLGVASLLSPWTVTAVLLQVLGYATMAVLDPVAAREGEAPRFFQRLRPVQMLVPIASLALILFHLLA